MPSIYQLKSRFQNLLRPLVLRLAASGVTANQVTIAAAGLSVVMGSILFVFYHHHWPWLLLPLFLFIRMAMNAVDGMLARDHGMKSRLGAMLNEIGDVVSDTALYLPFMLHAGGFGLIVVLICLAAVISEMAGIAGLSVNASRRYDGPMGKSDRAFAFGTLGLAIGVGFAPGWWFTAALAVIFVLLLLTVYNRVSNALKEGANAA